MFDSDWLGTSSAPCELSESVNVFLQDVVWDSFTELDELACCVSFSALLLPSVLPEGPCSLSAAVKFSWEVTAVDVEDSPFGTSDTVSANWV